MTETTDIKKYELIEVIEETKKPLLYPKDSFRRIRALIDIPTHNVKAGDLGGIVDVDCGLDHKGSCWIEKDSIIYRSFISGDVLVSGRSVIRDSHLHGLSRITDSEVYDSSLFGDHSVSKCIVHVSLLDFNGDINSSYVGSSHIVGELIEINNSRISYSSIGQCAFIDSYSPVSLHGIGDKDFGLSAYYSVINYHCGPKEILFRCENLQSSPMMADSLMEADMIARINSSLAEDPRQKESMLQSIELVKSLLLSKTA